MSRQSTFAEATVDKERQKAEGRRQKGRGKKEEVSKVSKVSRKRDEIMR